MHGVAARSSICWSHLSHTTAWKRVNQRTEDVRIVLQRQQCQWILQQRPTCVLLRLNVRKQAKCPTQNTNSAQLQVWRLDILWVCFIQSTIKQDLNLACRTLHHHKHVLNVVQQLHSGNQHCFATGLNSGNQPLLLYVPASASPRGRAGVLACAPTLALVLAFCCTCFCARLASR